MLHQHHVSAGIVLNCRRTALTSDIADKLIVSACACRNKNALRNSKLNSSKLPDIGVLETDLINVEEADEHAEALEEFWDDFFSEL